MSQYQKVDYSAIQKHIDEARIQRAVYLAELISRGVIAVKNFIWFNVESFLETKSLSRKSVFSID